MIDVNNQIRKSLRITPRRKFAAAIIVVLALVAGAGKISEASSETESAKNLGPKPIGTVETVTGMASAFHSDGTEVPLNAGDPVYWGDLLNTAGEARIGLRFIDDTRLSLGQDGRMVLDELTYDAKTHQGKLSVSVVNGAVSFFSGSIAKSGPDAMQVRTPVATIGIRGTKVAIKAGAEGEENVITLLEEEGGITGEIVVTNHGGSQILNEAGQTTSVWSFVGAPSMPIIMPPSQVDLLFSRTIEVLPERGAKSR
ncbi:MAG: hypothetical protein CMM08_14570 [Rhodospirillaceae bacterium]|jgi:hypothetical protein|nr:hypothetical protein [Rhodospirillaceae bacterium]MDP6622472.1 FecR domain-containing protein [Alphaproteobacteria bacterium]|tara:strand:+ start:705 stop:1469 length:765 start_codon:yes stop_codon:yes gene_type:complete